MEECQTDFELDGLCDPGEDDLDNEPRQPFFYLTRKSVEVLLGSNATAEQICAFMIASKSRYGSKSFLTAGSNAISKCLGIRPQKAKRIFTELSAINHSGVNLVKALPYAPIRRSVKFVDKGGIKDATLFQEQFIGHKTATREYPISKLCKAGDTAARLFLYAYSHSDAAMNGLVVSNASDTTLLKVINGVSIVYGEAPEISWPAKLIHGREKDYIKRELSNALTKLIDLKLLVPVIVAKAYMPNAIMNVCYDLHVKGEPLKGSLREAIMRIAQEQGVYKGRSDGRSHDGIYHAIVQQEYSVALYHILRPTYLYKAVDTGFSPMTLMLNSWFNSLRGTSVSSPANDLVPSVPAITVDVDF